MHKGKVMRYMYDATSVNAGALVAKNPQMIAIYLTGTPDIRWTSRQVAFFPRVKSWIRIDQGGPTSPQYMATVVDVESHAWSVSQAENDFLPKCTAPRPTVYCDRNDYQHVTARCDIWLAAPGITDDQALALRKADSRVVAVQNVFAGSYDRSVVFDDYWPEKPPAPEKCEVQVERWQAGFGWVLETTLQTDPGTRYRVRVSNGTWSPWQEVALP